MIIAQPAEYVNTFLKKIFLKKFEKGVDIFRQV